MPSNQSNYLRARAGGKTYALCLVPYGNGNPNMGGIPHVRRDGVTYDVYLVEQNDPTASPFRIRTTTGIKAAQLASYNITASAGIGGSINPSGEVTVYHGSNQTFNIAPNTGYSISSVSVDDASQGAISSYTFSNVQANHTISASFVSTCQSCYTTCETGCEVACQTGCEIICQSCNTCQSACELACQTGCQVTCQTGCEVSCQTGCQVSCQTGCQVSCQTGCEVSCQTGCEVACQTCNTCQTTCELSCQTGCEVSCQSGCEVSCQSGCEVSCQTGCEVSCETGCEVSCQSGQTVYHTLTVDAWNIYDQDSIITQVYIDGYYAGETPYSTQVAEGYHTIEVDNYAPDPNIGPYYLIGFSDQLENGDPRLIQSNTEITANYDLGGK